MATPPRGVVNKTRGVVNHKKEAASLPVTSSCTAQLFHVRLSQTHTLDPRMRRENKEFAPLRRS